MTAIRVDIPDGVAAPVWLAHVVRTAVTSHLSPNPPSLRVEPEGPDASVIWPDAAAPTEALS